jgi:hypothetical protein
MLRECPPASRSERAAAGTDSTMRRSARLPIAVGPARCRVLCCASPERGDVSATQTLSDRLRVVTAVAHHAIRTMAWTSAVSL